MFRSARSSLHCPVYPVTALLMITLLLAIQVVQSSDNNVTTIANNTSSVNVSAAIQIPVYNISMAFLDNPPVRTQPATQSSDYINYSSPYAVGGMSAQNRTAIILSGQLRSANLTWFSGHIFQNINSRYVTSVRRLA